MPVWTTDYRWSMLGGRRRGTATTPAKCKWSDCITRVSDAISDNNQLDKTVQRRVTKKRNTNTKHKHFIKRNAKLLRTC